jgi:polysaccharide biosynthesis transport protein
MQMEMKDPSLPSAVSIDRPHPAAPSLLSDAQSIDREPHLTQLGCILRRRRKLIVTIAALGVALAGTASLLVAPKYTATAQIVVEPEQEGPIGNRGEASRPTDQSAIDTHVTMLASRDNLGRVLDGLSHGFDPAAASRPHRLDTAEPRGAYLPQSDAPEGDVNAAETDPGLSLRELAHRAKIWLDAIFDNRPTASRELEEFDRGLKVLQERASRVISVSFTAKTPERAAAVANRVAQQYVEARAERTRALASQALIALDERGARLQGELDRATAVIQALLLAAPDAAGSASSKEQEKNARLLAVEREAAANGQAYAGLLQREKDIRDQQEIAKADVHILSLAAPPDRPSSPNPILFILPALIISLIGASLLAVLLERLDQGLHNEHDVTDALGFPCIGLVPQLPRAYANRPSSYLLSKPFTPYTEAIRSTVATLQLTEAHPRPRTVLVSSSVPGEGKTTVTVSLSAYAALLGKRVLLVDFDCRHPSALRVLGRPAKAASSRLQDRTLDSLIQHIPELKLDYFAVPLSASNPLVPFIDRRMHEFLRQIAKSYDCVFIDSPPLLGITETRLLAALVDSVIFVIKWGSTRREVVRNAGDLLRRALSPHSDTGVQGLALVTQVDLKRHADYRYGDVGEAFAKYRKYYFRPSKTA